MNFKISSQIEKKFKALKIEVVYLYGSEVQKTTDFESDIDIGVVLENPSILYSRDKTYSIYRRVYDLISGLLPKNFERELDLVFLQHVSYSLQFEAINHGKVLYETSPISRVNYEEKVLKNYLDIKPILEQFYQATLARIK